MVSHPPQKPREGGAPGLSTVQIRVSKIVGKKKIYDAPDSPVREVWAEVLPPEYNDDTCNQQKI